MLGAGMDGQTLGRRSPEDSSSALLLRGLCLLDWSESGCVLSRPLALPSGQGAFWASFPKAVPLSTSISLGTVHRDLGAPSRLFPLPLPAGVQQDCLSPKREQLVMSKSCQEKRSPIPPRPAFGCSSPRCCWLADGYGQQLGWWLGCSLLPCQKPGLHLRWPPWGRR